MRFERIQQWQILAAGALLSTIIPLIIILILWIWARGAIANAIESIFPGDFGKIATNMVFGLLAFYFLIKFLGRR